MKRLTIALSAVSLALSVTAAAAPSGEAPLDRGREATRLLLAEDAGALAARLSPEFLAQIGGVEGVGKFLTTVAEQAGTEQAVLTEHAFHEAGLTSYYRRSRFAKLSNVTTVWVIDDAGIIHAGSVRPTQLPAPSTHLDYRTRTQLRLPFGTPPEGKWYVGWGGRDLVHNYHAATRDQRFAYDLYISSDGMPYRTDGKANEDYYCFGQPILAPAAGKVVEAADGLPDNTPGVMDPANPLGNHVIIDHGNGEFSFLAHMQEGSVAPRTGDTVEMGERLGLCGNSGNTSMPHLHYHLQTTAVFAQGEGLPAQFNDYIANGAPVERGEPVRGEFLKR
jgi:murein DD-endopeptidase MepM/ murein hydrolase activator NlpD